MTAFFVLLPKRPPENSFVIRVSFFENHEVKYNVSQSNIAILILDTSSSFAFLLARILAEFPFNFAEAGRSAGEV